MLTKLVVRNFKRFEDAEIELGNPVVFVGPNNSGKTSALQALDLWNLGVRRWNERHAGKGGAPEQRPGVTINRQEPLSLAHPNASHFWRNLCVRKVQRKGGKLKVSNLRIDLIVEGIDSDEPWKCGLEFDYANPEFFYCRPLRIDQNKPPGRMPMPEAAARVRIAYLPPMSGLVANETRLEPGAVNVRIGEGRTAEVLRNLCFRIHTEMPGQWTLLTEMVARLFGTRLQDPRHVEGRGEITMSYQDPNGTELDLSSSGRGLQQTLLLLSYMYAHPGQVILLDEPDAHLEILRQQQIYDLIGETASASGSQIVVASHSEVLLNSAADKDMAIAFIGKPHRIDRGGSSQLKKALASIGWEQYLQAEQVGWVLYLEGPTDLAILQSFARRLGKGETAQALERPFVRYVGNQPKEAEVHFNGLREAFPNLAGIALYDRLDINPYANSKMQHMTWQRREIENYLCSQATLESYACATAEADAIGPLFAPSETARRNAAMQGEISKMRAALETVGKGSPWDADFKASDDFLIPLFRNYFAEIGLPNLMNKKSFHELANHVPEAEIDPEIGKKLDAITAVAKSARRETDA